MEHTQHTCKILFHIIINHGEINPLDEGEYRMSCRNFYKELKILWVLFVGLGAMLGSAQGAALTGYNVDINQTTVSGLSSGAFMAVQFDIAFSSFVKGTGVIAGGPYFCAQDDVTTATTVCSCTGFSCSGAPDVPSLIRITDRNAGQGSIDPTSNLARQRFYLFSGTADTIVPQRVMDSLKTQYRSEGFGANARQQSVRSVRRP